MSHISVNTFSKVNASNAIGFALDFVDGNPIVELFHQYYSGGSRKSIPYGVAGGAEDFFFLFENKSSGAAYFINLKTGIISQPTIRTIRPDSFNPFLKGGIK